MLRADLQCPRGSMRSKKFVTRIAVINREHVTAIEFARYVVDPIECREVNFGLVIRRAHGQFLQMIAQRSFRNRLIDEYEHVAIQRDKFFQPCAFRRGAELPPTFRDDQVRWHGIEKLVGKMNSYKWLKHID